MQQHHRGSGVSAANVGSLDLSGAQGHTSITAGRISGDLAGTLLVEVDSGNGGTMNLIINGDADITCETIAAGDTLQIDGTASGDITINGDIEYDSGTSTKGTLVIGTATGGTLRVCLGSLLQSRAREEAVRLHARNRSLTVAALFVITLLGNS